MFRPEFRSPSGHDITGEIKRERTVSTAIFISILLSWPEGVQNSGKFHFLFYSIIF